MTRVLVIASAGPRAALLSEAFVRDGLMVMATAERLDAVPAATIGQSDAIVIADEHAYSEDQLADALGERLDMAIVVAAESPDMMASLARRAEAWAIVPPGVPARVLSAVVRSTAAGFVSVPGAWASNIAADALPSRAPSLEADAVAFEEPLTAREREILSLVADGLSNRTIASRLGISEHTVKFHLSTVFGKLGAANRAEAVARGWQRGLVPL